MKEKIDFIGWPDWSEQYIQELSLDELSELKKIELFLPRNVFLTIDYDDEDEDEDEEEYTTKEDTELADFITDAEDMMKNSADKKDYESLFGRYFLRTDDRKAILADFISDAEDMMKNSADKKDYESLFGRYFLRTDDRKAIHILKWPKTNPDEYKFSELIKAGHHPFIYEVVEYNPVEDTRYNQKVGWHYPYLSFYETIFHEDNPALVSRYEVNLPVDEGTELYYDASENVLWEGENDWTDWDRYEEIDAVLFEEFITEAEKYKKEDEKIAKKRQEYARKFQEEREAADKAKEQQQQDAH